MVRKQCSKSPSGKHDWTYNIKVIKGVETQYRRCDYCDLRQKHVVNQKTGYSEGWKRIGFVK